MIMSTRFQTPCWVLGGMEVSLEDPEFHLQGAEGSVIRAKELEKRGQCGLSL